MEKRNNYITMILRIFVVCVFAVLSVYFNNFGTYVVCTAGTIPVLLR